MAITPASHPPAFGCRARLPIGQKLGAGGPKGYDAGKKIKGRKRHLVTDTLGLVVAVLITADAVQDRDAALPAIDMAMAKAPGIQMVYVDSAYAGKRANEIRHKYDINVEIVRHPMHRRTKYWDEGQPPLLELESPKGSMVHQNAG